MWWPFKKRIDPVSIRLAGHDSHISSLYQRVYHLECMVATFDRRIRDLEKILKSCNITVTVVEKK